MYKYTFLAFISIGCGYETAHHSEFSEYASYQTYNYRADVSFTTDERKCLIAYASVMSQITHTPIKINFDYQHPATNSVPDYSVIIRADYAGGLYTYSNRAILVGINVPLYDANGVFAYNAQATPRQLGFILAHEIGHDFGFLHVAGTDSLMYPIANGDGSFLWSENDQDECIRNGYCTAVNTGKLYIGFNNCDVH